MSALSLQQIPVPMYDGPADTNTDEFDPEAVEQPEEEAPAREPNVLRLEDIAAKGIDLAFELPDDVLGRIAAQCLEGYERDKAEREDWEADWEAIMAMARGDRQETSFPWAGASNVKYPLILTASLQFGARAYPAIVKGQEVARVRTVGQDPDGLKRARAGRVAEHMNWQLLEDMPEWEDETDKLVHMLPFHGCVFRQGVWDSTYTRPKTSLVSARHLVVTQGAKDLETVPLFCKEFDLFPHQITERMRKGEYVETEVQFDGDHRQAEQAMLECHCRYDLDEDGYDEPWIAIIHKSGQKLLSLKAGFWPKGVIRAPGEPDPVTFQPTQGRVLCVRRHIEFVKYDFIPNFEGKFLGVGFGFLLREHNQIINSIINQLLDAATDQNAGGGFIGKGVGLKGGRLEWEPGEWKFVNVAGGNLRENMVPRPTSQPSDVLFKLLGLMIEAGKELAAIRDALSGEVQANQPATTTLAIIEQGLQVFSSIYKRIYRSLGHELNLLYELNSAYLPDEAYFFLLDDEKAIARADYADGDYDIRPVSDPSKTTSAQRLGKAQFLAPFAGDPDMDGRAIKRRMLEAAEIEDIDELMPEKQEDPQAKLMAIRKMLAEIRKDEATADEKEASAKLKDIEAVIEAMTATLDAGMTITAMESIPLGAPDGGPPQVPAAPPLGGGPPGMGGMAGPGQNPSAPPFPQAPVPGDALGMGGVGMGQPGPIGPGAPGIEGAIDGLRRPVGPELGDIGGVAG